MKTSTDCENICKPHEGSSIHVEIESEINMHISIICPCCNNEIELGYYIYLEENDKENINLNVMCNNCENRIKNKINVKLKTKVK